MEGINALNGFKDSMFDAKLIEAIEKELFAEEEENGGQAGGPMFIDEGISRKRIAEIK